MLMLLMSDYTEFSKIRGLTSRRHIMVIIAVVRYIGKTRPASIDFRMYMHVALYWRCSKL